MYAFIEKQFQEWETKHLWALLRGGETFYLVQQPIWIGIGMVANAISLMFFGLVSVVVTYSAETPLDIVLNSLALFFLIQIDNGVVSTNVG